MLRFWLIKKRERVKSVQNNHRKITALSCLSILFVFTIVAFNLLRFVNVSADFPQKVTWSQEIYTDEGLWLSGAVRQYMTGSWYMEGDLNLAVNHPVLPLIMFPIFKIFGMNLMVARLTIVLFCIFTIALVYWLVKEYADRTWALLAASILSVNYTLFAYSRTAMLEIPMMLFIMSACVLMRISLKHGSLLAVILSSFFVTIAMLTKATAVFVVPLLWYMIVAAKEKGRMRHFILFTIMAAFFYSVYYISFALRYLSDYNFFVTTGVEFRFSSAASEHVIYKAAEIIKNYLPSFGIEGIMRYCSGNGMLCRFLSTLIGCVASFQVDKILYPAIAITASYLMVRYKRDVFRNNLFLFSIMWIILYLALICSNSYFPPRYFLPMIIPIAMLTAL